MFLRYLIKVMSEERNYTSIQVSNDTRDKIKLLALTPNESYEQILQRVLDSKIGSRELHYLIRNVDEDCNLKAVVDWGLPQENIKFYDKDGNCGEGIPLYDFDDKDFQVKWDSFVESVNGLDNLVKILAVLEAGESIRTDDIILSRL